MIKKLFLIILVLGIAVILTAQGALSPKQKPDSTNNITTLPAPNTSTITPPLPISNLPNDLPPVMANSKHNRETCSKCSKSTLCSEAKALLPTVNANIELAWGTNQAKAIEKITSEPNFKDSDSIWYDNQLVIDKSAKVSYFFNKDSLWRKVVFFDNHSHANYKNLKDLLTKKYGMPVKGFRDTWENYDSRIFLFIDRNGIRLVYDDKLNAEKIIKELENKQLKEI